MAIPVSFHIPVAASKASTVRAKFMRATIPRAWIAGLIAGAFVLTPAAHAQANSEAAPTCIEIGREFDQRLSNIEKGVSPTPEQNNAWARFSTAVRAAQKIIMEPCLAKNGSPGMIEMMVAGNKMSSQVEAATDEFKKALTDPQKERLAKALE
jgi:LTXXQ motif family protein